MEKPEEVLDLEQHYRQQHVVLKGDHPHAGRAGVVRGAEYVSTIGKWGFVVDLSPGESCFVFHPKHWTIYRSEKL